MSNHHQGEASAVANIATIPILKLLHTQEVLLALIEGSRVFFGSGTSTSLVNNRNSTIVQREAQIVIGILRLTESWIFRNVSAVNTVTHEFEEWLGSSIKQTPSKFNGLR